MFAAPGVVKLPKLSFTFQNKTKDLPAGGGPREEPRPNVKGEELPGQQGPHPHLPGRHRHQGQEGQRLQEGQDWGLLLFLHTARRKCREGWLDSPKRLQIKMRGLPRKCGGLSLGHLGTRAKSARIPRSSSSDVQSVPAGGVQIPHWTVPTLPRKKPSSRSINGRLRELHANKFQAYRQRVIHLEANERMGSKDERKKRGECKADFQPTQARQTSFSCSCAQHRKTFFFLSILSPTDSSSPSSMTSRGSTTPRSPTSTTPPSTTT